MKIEWKDPNKHLPTEQYGKYSVCCIVTTNTYAQYPEKAWYNFDSGLFYLASWDYFAEKHSGNF